MAKSLVLNRNRKVPAEDTAAFGAIAERFRRAGALERAVDLCREGLQKFPDHISARVTLGWSLLDLGKYDEARVELEQVLRRAPDNLAAIRGLAELHDRFEHTLNLPMDGPGQWPPPPEAVEETAPAASAAPAAENDLEMTPAEMGIPIWSAAVQAAEEPAPEPMAAMPPPAPEPPPVVAPPPVATEPQTPTKSKKSKSAKPAPVAEPVATEPIAKEAPAPVEPPRPVEPVAPVAPAAAASASGMSSVREISASPASGMSSVREIDFGSAASVALPEPAAAAPPPVVAAPVESSPQASDYAVSDADIQALLAEADSLDSAAGFQPATESETVSLDAMALGTEDPLAAIAEIAPASAPTPAYGTAISVDFDLGKSPAVADAGAAVIEEAAQTVQAEVEEPVIVAHATMTPVAETQVETVAEVQASAVEEQVPVEPAALSEPAAAVAEPVTMATPEPVAEIVEPVAVVSPEPVAEVVEPVAPVAPEPVAEVVEPVAEVTPEPDVLAPAAMAMPEPVAEVVQPAALVTPEPIAEVPAAEIAAAVDAISSINVASIVEEVAVAAVGEVVSIESGRAATRSAVPALERLLAKVQARRAQLMTESVA